jgi:tagatose 6-phosphate kinase
MILTVTLNAALDITYQVPAMIGGTTHRVSEVAERAGGKGLNVARLLHALGEPVVATGLAGGTTGARIRSLLAAEGVPDSFVPVAAESRRTVTVADEEEATGFWEPGPLVTAAEWRAFVTRYTGLMKVAEVAVLAGSLPPGVPEDAYATLLGLARAAGVCTVLDADGPALRHGLAARPDLVKPNARELSHLQSHVLGRRVAVGSLAGAHDAVEAMRGLGAKDVVATLAGAGLIAFTRAGTWRAYLPSARKGNPTGAGDACVVALVSNRRRPWPERLVDAVALAAATVAQPVAGTVELLDWRRLRHAVRIEAW